MITLFLVVRGAGLWEIQYIRKEKTSGKRAREKGVERREEKSVFSKRKVLPNNILEYVRKNFAINFIFSRACSRIRQISGCRFIKYGSVKNYCLKNGFNPLAPLFFFLFLLDL